MEKNEILEKLTEIFHDVMDNEDIVISENTSADNMEEWDSLSHIQLVVAVEREFGIKFNSKEITTWKNVGDMINSILSK